MPRRILSIAMLGASALSLILAPAVSGQATEREQPSGRPSLGIAVQAASGEQEGLVVQRVVPQGPADKAGLRPGDVITRAGNRAIEDPETFLNILAQHRPGDKLSLRVERNGQSRDLTVTLGQRSSDSSSTAQAQPGHADEQNRRTAWLGVMASNVQDLSPRMRQRLGIEARHGLVVLEVMPNSPASRAGLRHGDVITGIDGKEISTQQQLAEAIRRAGPDRQVTLEVQRGEHEKELTARLQEAPADMAIASPASHGEAGAEATETARQVQQLQREVEQLRQRVRDLEQTVRSIRTTTPQQ